jgi:phage terminase large subunit-like protein
MKEDRVVITSATTYDNPHLAARAINALKSRYENTALGRQELLAIIMDAAEGALWNYDMIKRIDAADFQSLFRVVVAIDPAVSMGTSSAETGIVVVARTMRGSRLVP